MCRNEQFVWRSEDKVFRMNSMWSYRIGRFTHDKHWISLKLHELRNLQSIFHMITNQFFIYTEALGDVHAYVNTTMASCNYIEPGPNASKSIITDSRFLTSSSHLYISNIHFNKICIGLLTCFLFLPYLFYTGTLQGKPSTRLVCN